MGEVESNSLCLPSRTKSSPKALESQTAQPALSYVRLLQCIHTQLADNEILADPRFSNIHSDPRFKLPSKKHTHVQLDKRFSRMLKDEDFSRKAAVDRYGRALPKDAGKKDLKRLYRTKEEDEADASEPEDEEDGIDDDEQVEEELRRVEKNYDPARQGGFSSSSEEEDTSDEEDAEVEEEEFEFPDRAQAQDGGVPMGEVTSRLAVVNLDWDNIRAEDLMAVFSSFLPSTGAIQKVAVYPSEFGRERMEREDIEGPPKEIFGSRVAEDALDMDDSASDDDDEEGDEDEDEEDEEKIKRSILKEDRGEEFDPKLLRRYQLDRLRYYYAVLTFSSPLVAKAIYDAVDGTEYLTTANFFDLRFIPDDTDFSDDTPRDECQRIPDNYKPNEFVTDALQHSNVKLTWDADDVTRKEAQAKAFKGGRKELDENDLKAYLGSDSSDNEDDEPEPEVVDATSAETAQAAPAPEPKMSKKEAERRRMRALLGLGDEPAPSRKSKPAAGPVGDMQVTFSSGLSSAPTKGSVFENEPEETTVEKYVRREKERKQRRKEKYKATRAGVEPAEDGGKEEAGPEAAPAEDLGFDDPFFAAPEDDKAAASALRKEERRKRREERAAEAAASDAKRAELELLMVDEKEGDVQHFDMREIEKAEKAARRRGKGKGKLKGKKGAEAATAAAGAEDTFKMDTQDPRFQRLFESHDFAIDPTNPRFKGTGGMKALLEEGRKRRKQGDEAEHTDDKSQARGKKRKTENGKGGEDGEELRRLVNKVKGKTAKA